jgi:hypothetical protein
VSRIPESENGKRRSGISGPIDVKLRRNASRDEAMALNRKAEMTPVLSGNISRMFVLEGKSHIHALKSHNPGTCDFCRDSSAI